MVGEDLVAIGQFSLQGPIARLESDESFAYCDRQYAAMTDAAGTPIVKFDAGGEGSRVPIQMPRFTVLAFHTAHAFEHYGNIVTYMRLKNVVPPSSEPPFGTYKPK